MARSSDCSVSCLVDGDIFFYLTDNSNWPMKLFGASFHVSGGSASFPR